MEKKIAIISDIYSNYFMLNKILEQLQPKNIEEYIFCGDYVLDGFDGDKVIHTIRNIKNKVVVRGNKEDRIEKVKAEEIEKLFSIPQFANIAYSAKNLSIENKQYIKSLPLYEIKEVEGVKICICHATPYSTNEEIGPGSKELFCKMIKDFGCDVYIMGHSHEAWHRAFQNALFINTGSISIPVDGPKAKYGILTITEGKIAYEAVHMSYNMEEIIAYYQSNEEYCQKVKDWSSIILTMIRDGCDHREYAFKYAKQIANSRNIEYENEIPPDIWKQMYEDYDKKYHFVKI